MMNDFLRSCSQKRTVPVDTQQRNGARWENAHLKPAKTS